MNIWLLRHVHPICYARAGAPCHRKVKGTTDGRRPPGSRWPLILDSATFPMLRQSAAIITWAALQTEARPQEGRWQMQQVSGFVGRLPLCGTW